MMGRLRAMREPLKYVQGRNALLKFQEEMGYMGTRWLFVCSKSGYKACHDKLEESFGQCEDYRRYEIFGGVSSHSEIDKMKAIVEEDKIDTVVAVGGRYRQSDCFLYRQAYRHHSDGCRYRSAMYRSVRHLQR